MRSSPIPLSLRREERPGESLAVCNIDFELVTTSENGTKSFPAKYTPRRWLVGDLYFVRWLIAGLVVGLAVALFRPWTVAAGWALASFGLAGSLVLLFRYVELFSYNNETREAFEKEQRLWSGSVDDWMSTYLSKDLDKVVAKLKAAAKAYVQQHAEVVKLRRELLGQLLTSSQEITKLANFLNDRVPLKFWEQGDECNKCLCIVLETQGKLVEAAKMHDTSLDAVMVEIEAVRNIPINHETAGGVRLIGWMHGEVVGHLHLLPETSMPADDVNRELKRQNATYTEILTLAQKAPDFIAVLQSRMILQELQSTRETMIQEFRLLASTITTVEAKLNAKIEEAAIRLESASRQSALLVSKAIHSAANRISAQVSLSSK